MKTCCGIDCPRCNYCDAEVLKMERGCSVLHLRCLSCDEYWIAELS